MPAPDNEEIDRIIHESGVSDDYAVSVLKAKLKPFLEELVNRARVEELELIMKMPGNCFFGNGENEIQWATRNRIATLSNIKREGGEG